MLAAAAMPEQALGTKPRKIIKWQLRTCVTLDQTAEGLTAAKLCTVLQSLVKNASGLLGMSSSLPSGRALLLSSSLHDFGLLWVCAGPD